ncbi:hypothetical protein TNIN_475981 [Trichonephila inaurata madagascariensis]|uniref:Uncharacterized protein n=1 Tax=Trichonephila inaurata madagascariensis TaxID=2747483 RepID=A0A8X7BXD2_9ARAC|nr:hypothetical protein TNIN_475981 [Trichonephila inaurata madagascariensis]
MFHYAERCVARCVFMVQPPIVSDGWEDSSKAFSQSCEDFHAKPTAFTICPTSFGGVPESHVQTWKGGREYREES